MYSITSSLHLAASPNMGGHISQKWNEFITGDQEIDRYSWVYRLVIENVDRCDWDYRSVVENIDDYGWEYRLLIENNGRYGPKAIERKMSEREWSSHGSSTCYKMIMSCMYMSLDENFHWDDGQRTFKSLFVYLKFSVIWLHKLSRQVSRIFQGFTKFDVKISIRVRIIL